MKDKVGTKPSQTAVQKAFKVLDVLVSSATAVSLSELSAKTNLTKPSVHRLLQQLEEIGVIEQNVGDSQYIVGRNAHGLAIKILSASTMRAGVRDVMISLVQEVKESCNLSMMCENEAIYIDRVECDWPLRVHYKVGLRVPLHATGAGKLLLAYLPPDRRNRMINKLTLKRYTEKTITNPAQLRAECDEIIKDGVSLYSEEFHHGEIGVAVPVRKSDGTVIAALSIHAPIFRMSLLSARANEPILRIAVLYIGPDVGTGCAGTWPHRLHGLASSPAAA